MIVYIKYRDADINYKYYKNFKNRRISRKIILACWSILFMKWRIYCRRWNIGNSPTTYVNLVSWVWFGCTVANGSWFISRCIFFPTLNSEGITIRRSYTQSWFTSRESSSPRTELTILISFIIPHLKSVVQNGPLKSSTSDYSRLSPLEHGPSAVTLLATRPNVNNKIFR